MANGSENIINAAQNYPLSQIFNNDPNKNNINVYRVPRFQREYAWKREQWEALYDDLKSNQQGYFLGSIITVPAAEQGHRLLELIDGQQRLATVSIFMAVLYEFLSQLPDLDEDDNLEIANLKNRLIVKKTQDTRMILQRQNNNKEDYEAKLYEAAILQYVEKPKRARYRKIFKAYEYLRNRIDAELADKDDDERKEFLFDLYERLLAANLINIEVNSHANAYILFESLNNRGLPLSALDIIKNSFLGALEQADPEKIDENYDIWNRILANLGDDIAIQERFFRQYINAFISEYSEILKTKSLIGKSDMIGSYGKLIASDSQGLLRDIHEASSIYSLLVCNTTSDDKPVYQDNLERLLRVKAAPAYALLLYLFLNQKKLELSDSQLNAVIRLITRFFIRRHLTDTPPTRDLDRLFIDIIAGIREEKATADDLLELVATALKSVSPDDEEVEAALKGPLYDENTDLTRYILCMLEENETAQNDKEDKGLWAVNEKEQYIWTIEHILPKCERLPDCWVEMLTGDRKAKGQAREIQEEYVHTLGNLTLSGYNANLSNKCFEDKKDKKTRKGKYIGYRNGLWLNQDVIKAKKWTKKKIEDRTEKLAALALRLCSLD